MWVLAMRTDFYNLKNGDLLRLYPKPDNLKYPQPLLVRFDKGNYYHDDAFVYFYGDVEHCNQGFLLVETQEQGATP